MASPATSPRSAASPGPALPHRKLHNSSVKTSPRQQVRLHLHISNCTKTTINNQDQYNSYQINAVPNAVGKTGNRGYCTDENGTIRYDPKGGTNCTELLQ